MHLQLRSSQLKEAKRTAASAKKKRKVEEDGQHQNADASLPQPLALPVMHHSHAASLIYSPLIQAPDQQSITSSQPFYHKFISYISRSILSSPQPSESLQKHAWKLMAVMVECTGEQLGDLFVEVAMPRLVELMGERVKREWRRDGGRSRTVEVNRRKRGFSCFCCFFDASDRNSSMWFSVVSLCGCE